MGAAILNHKQIVEDILFRLATLAMQRDSIEHEICNLQAACHSHVDLIDNEADRHVMKAALGMFDTRIHLVDLIKLCLQFAKKPMTPARGAAEIPAFIHHPLG
ncbi:MAG TPA: hypothetical protein VN682_20315 [Terriglobales bacterium]|nr:hypothetical protein [Terriglobales bacterium]